MGKKIIVLVIAVLIIGGAAYGLTRNNDKPSTDTGGTYSNTSQNTTPNPTPSSSNSANQESTNPASSSSQSTSDVTISNMAFSPNSITVKKGTTVTWTNNDSVAHTVQESDGKTGPKSDTLAHGAAYTFTYTTAGSFAYHCSIHPNMTGTVVVTE